MVISMISTSLYVALGDSITAGYGVGNHNFAQLYYSTLLSQTPNLRFINFGINGLTTSKLSNLLISNPSLRNFITQARVITLTIGSNDLIGTGISILRGTQPDIPATLANLAQQLQFIGQQIRSLNPVALVKVSTIYNPLLAGPYYQYSAPAQELMNQANKIIVHWAKRYGFGVVQVDRVFRGKENLVIGPDHFHPNLIGHQIIATEFAKNNIYYLSTA